MVVAVLYDPYWPTLLLSNGQAELIECGSESEIGIHSIAPHGLIKESDL